MRKQLMNKLRKTGYRSSAEKKTKLFKSSGEWLGYCIDGKTSDPIAKNTRSSRIETPRKTERCRVLFGTSTLVESPKSKSDS